MPRESTNELDEAETESRRTENWAEDQQDRGYYYDDAHGYEKYCPDGDDDESEDEADRSA